LKREVTKGDNAFPYQKFISFCLIENQVECIKTLWFLFRLWCSSCKPMPINQSQNYQLTYI